MGVYGCSIFLTLWVFMGDYTRIKTTRNMIKTDALQITPELLRLIADIDEFKGAWRALGTLAPERLLALRHVATIESIGSSTRIEGSRLTDREVEKLLANVQVQKFESRDEQEVAGYAAVMETITHAWSSIPISENHIKQLHRDLLRFSEKDERHRGEYKKLRNDVGAFDADGKMVGIVFETASPFDTPQRMEELLTWFHLERELGLLHPLIIIAIFVVVLLEIHPFQDGNGRLSRTLTTLLLLQSGYAYVPYASLENVIEHSKESYYLALRQTQSTIRTESPNWQPWLLYFLRALQKQKFRLAEKMEREKMLLTDLPELSAAIMEEVRRIGRTKIGDMVKLTGASRNTLKEHFKRLVEQGYLQQYGERKGTWYGLP